MAALDVVNALGNVKTMLANTTTWQTICGGVSASQAALRIFEGGIEENGETSAPCIILNFSSLPTNWMGNRFMGRLTVEIRCEIPIPEDNQTSYADEFVYAWTQLAGLLDGINAAVGGAGQLMADSLEVATPPGRIDPAENNERVEWGFIIALSTKFM